MAEEQDGGTTFSPTNSSKEQLNTEQISQNNFRLLAEDTRRPEKQPIVFEQLQIASRGHQAPRKATHSLRREVGQNINTYFRQEQGLKINDLINIHIRKLEKKNHQQLPRKMEEKIQIRGEINEIRNKSIIERYNKSRKCLL